jgi:hypothetical protein
MSVPSEVAAVLLPFACLFTQPTWLRVGYLICGAILTTGPRTVCSILRALGLSRYKQFQNFHRVLNRAQWSSYKAAQVLSKLLIQTFVPSGPIVFGIDELLERRWGKKIAARAIYRDSSRSSKGFMVKSSGLRWISLQVLVPIPWAKRIWGLPFLTVLAPSERYNQKRRKRHKTIITWAKQLVGQIRRWWPDRPLILVGDSTYSALELLAKCQELTVTLITRLRLDAALYTPAPARPRGKTGRPRSKGKRLPTLNQVLADRTTQWKRTWVNWYGQGKRLIEFSSCTAVWYHAGKKPVPIRWVLVRDPKGRFETQAFLSTDLELDPVDILRYFMHRWSMEVTFQESRSHLGIDGQRQWSDRAIARATPSLLGLFSLVTLMADKLQAKAKEKLTIGKTAWYGKDLPTFSDALSWVRNGLWQQRGFWTSLLESDVGKTQHDLFNHMTERICQAA